MQVRIDLISTFPFLIRTNLSSSILWACLRHWPEAWVRPEPGAASPTNGREAALPAGGASASHSHERKSWGQAMVLQPWPSLCQLQTPETLRHATLIRAWSPHSVTSDDDDDAPGVRRVVTDRPLARPLSLQLSAAEITSAPRALCTAALQSLKLQSNGIFITRTWHSELDVWGKLLYSITYICHRRNPHQPEDKTQVKEVFSFFQCSYFRPEHSTIPADKSGGAALLMSLWEWHLKEVMSLYFVCPCSISVCSKWCCISAGGELLQILQILCIVSSLHRAETKKWQETGD